MAAEWKMAEDDYDDSFSDDSDGEGPEHGQGSVELFSGYYGQGGFRAEYIYDVLEAARKSQSSPKQRRLKFNFGAWKLPKVGKKKKNEVDILDKVLPENPVFGVPVDVAVQRSILVDGIELPTVFRQCIDFLEERGLEQEGLYRLPGVKSLVQNLKDAYDRDERVDLSSSEVHTVASLLKLYLRELPEPIFTFHLGPLFDEAVGGHPEGEEQVRALQDVLAQLPPANRLLLGWLMVHIEHLTAKESTNLMSVSNVIVVFQPTLQATHQVLYALIHNTAELFSDIQLTRYIPPEVPQIVESVGSLRLSQLRPDILELDSEEDITSEIKRLETEQQVVLSTLKQRFDAETDNQAWEIQRLITEFRRKLKMLRKKKVVGPHGGDDKTGSSKEDMEESWEMVAMEKDELELLTRKPTQEDIEASMAAELQEILLKTEASLVKERNALSVLKEALKDEIDKERSAVARLKEKLSRVQDDGSSSDESGDEAVLEAKFLKSLKEVRDLRSENEEIREHVMSELESIARLRVEEGEESMMDEER